MDTTKKTVNAAAARCFFTVILEASPRLLVAGDSLNLYAPDILEDSP